MLQGLQSTFRPPQTTPVAAQATYSQQDVEYMRRELILSSKIRELE